MTVYLDTDHADCADDEPAVLNTISILFINILAVFGITLGACVMGLPLGLALLTGWLCGAAVTLVVVAGIIALLPVAARREPAQLQPPLQAPAVARSRMMDWIEDEVAEARTAAYRSLLLQWREDDLRDQAAGQTAAREAAQEEARRAA